MIAARVLAGVVELRVARVVLGAAVPEHRVGMAREQRPREEQLRGMEDRDRRRRARQPHALRLPDGEPRRDVRRHAGEREARRVDGHDAVGAQQRAHGLLEVEALELPGQQQDEQWLVHGA